LKCAQILALSDVAKRNRRSKDVRALDILHKRLTDAMGFMHKARWNALWLIAIAAIEGERLWLTALGRARPGGARPKHAIKAVDRLLGNGAAHKERFAVYRAIAHLILRDGSHPIVLVDTVEVRAGWFALVASVPFRGRSFPICAHTTRRVKPRRPALRQFLGHLKEIIPTGCRPIFVSDAGFESPWFNAVAERGWDYVGRIRNLTKLQMGGRWMEHSEIHRLATNRAKNLGTVEFPRSAPRPRRAVLSKEPEKKHRHRRNRSGRIGHQDHDHRYRDAAHEPWLLTTSLTARPSTVVAIFAQRMRIEETFRDVKNHRWGWSLRHCGSRTRERLDVLLLVATLGLFMQQLVGVAAENLRLHREHQANTERRRRVLSLFVLGGYVLRARDARVRRPELIAALAEIRAATSVLDQVKG